MFYYGLAWLYRDDVATLADYISIFDRLAKQKYPQIIAHFVCFDFFFFYLFVVAIP